MNAKSTFVATALVASVLIFGIVSMVSVPAAFAEKKNKIVDDDSGGLIITTNEDDQVKGRGGDDTIAGFGGDDNLKGNDGDDRLVDADVLDDGKDKFNCGKGEDTVVGLDEDSGDKATGNCENFVEGQ